jgi:hypothetical protein
MPVDHHSTKESSLPKFSEKELIEKLEDGTLKEIPLKDLLKSLETSGFLGWVTGKGLLEKIPKEILTEDLLLKPNIFGNNPLHDAATRGTLHKIPKEFLTEKTLSTPNRQNQNCFELATETGYLETIPEELVTLERLKDENKEYAMTAFHRAAIYGMLSRIPKKFLTRENLLLTNRHGQNCFHLAALHNKAHKIPQEFLKEDSFLIPDTNGDTAFDLAGREVHIKTFPPHLITPKNLIQNSQKQWNWFHALHLENRLHTLPKFSLTELKTLHKQFQTGEPADSPVEKWIKTQIDCLLITRSLRQDHKPIY